MCQAIITNVIKSHQILVDMGVNALIKVVGKYSCGLHGPNVEMEIEIVHWNTRFGR